MSDPVLECRDIVVEYPGHPPLRAVDGVSFALHRGEVVGLVGESGCGKSTMAKVLTGLLRPNSGSVNYQGQRLHPLGLSGRSPGETGIQMVFQDPGSSLNPRRRVGAQIADGLQAARLRAKWENARGAVASPPDGTSGPGVGDPERPQGAGPAPTTPEQWLSRIGMEPSDARRYPRSFSGGQRQRIAAARALAAEPSVLIGDEPISALDASTQARVAYLMSTLAVAQGASLLFISHDLSVVRLIADRILVMYRGHIVERGPTDEIWSDPKHLYTKALLGAIPVPDGAGRLPAITPPDPEYPLEEALH
jgi:peptide/nickel transport system ATP-binding protein